MQPTLSHPRPALPAARLALSRLRQGGADIFASFSWALEMRRRCDAHARRHGPLDAATIARIAAEIDAEEANRRPAARR